MAYVQGLIDTEDVVADEKIVDMSELIHKRQIDRSEFKTMLEKLGTKPATREKINWLEEDLPARVSSTALSATSADTALTVTTGHGTTIFRLWDVVRNEESGEAYLVTSVSANSVGITRTWGATAAASSTSAAQLVIVGNASAQGASSGTAIYLQRTANYNYVQDQRDPIFFTDLQTDIALYGGGEPEKELVRKMDVHLRAVETTLFFGARDFDASATPAPRGSAGGLVEFITTNITSAGGALTPVEMDTFLEAPFGVGARGRKVLFAAPKVAGVLSQMYRDKWQPTTAGAGVTYGAQVGAFIHSIYGTSIPVVVKREWSDMSAAGSNYGTWAFLVDLDNVRLRPIPKRWNVIRKNIQEPSATAVVHEYRSEYSLEVGVESSMAILKNVTSYSAT